MTTVTTTPAVVDVKRGQHIIITVEGVPAIFIKSDSIRPFHPFEGDSFDHYEFVAMGLTVRTNPASYESKYVSSCANTMNLEVTALTPDAVVDAAAKRYNR